LKADDMNANTIDGKRLQGKRVAVLMTDGVEQVEYTEPRGYLEARGGQR
jgi:protease I